MRRLFIIGPKWIGGWLEGVENAAREMGYTTGIFQYETPFSPSVSMLRAKINWLIPHYLRKFFLPTAELVGGLWEDRMNRKVIEIVSTFQPDLILILKGETLKANTLKNLRIQGRRIVSWWLDDPLLYISEKPEIQDQFKHLDVLFVFDRGHLNDLKMLGAPMPTYLPCAFDPAIYHPKKVSSRDFKQYYCDIGFIASYYPERGELLKYMKGLKVAIWGGGWKAIPEIRSFPPRTLRGKSLAGPKVATAYNIMPICLNLHHSQTLIGGLNMRAFEIPAAGGFQLMDYVPGAEELFEPGLEIVMARSPAHFRELANFYLAHPEERLKITKAGMTRALRDHTYRNRLQFVFDTLERI